jgi:hypothetical protein
MTKQITTYTANVTGISASNVISSASEITARQNTSTAINNTGEVVAENRELLEAIHTTDHIINVTSTSFSGGTNELSILANAIVWWDESVYRADKTADAALTGWPAKTITGLTTSNTFYIWATFVSGTKDYEATNITAALPSNLTEKCLIGIATVSGAGAVTFAVNWQGPTQTRENYFRDNQTFLNGVNFTGGTNIVPVGSMTYWVAPTAPTGWLIRDGSAISRTAYSNLFNVLNPTGLFASQNFTVTIASPCVLTKTAHYMNHGARLRLSTTGALPTGLNTTTDYFVFYIDANTFGLCSDEMLTTRINTSGTQSGTHSYLQSLYGLGNGTTTFNLPDDRGVFLRGVDSSKGYDTNRAFGTAQNDDFKSHNHTEVAANGSGTVGNAGFQSNAQITNTGSTGGTETRPKNRAYLPIIKF